MTWPMSEFSASFPFPFLGERCEEFALRLFLAGILPGVHFLKIPVESFFS